MGVIARHNDESVICGSVDGLRDSLAELQCFLQGSPGVAPVMGNVNETTLNLEINNSILKIISRNPKWQFPNYMNPGI